jgi:hypothetical protein
MEVYSTFTVDTKELLLNFCKVFNKGAVAKHPQAIKAVGFYVIGLFSRRKRE